MRRRRAASRMTAWLRAGRTRERAPGARGRARTQPAGAAARASRRGVRCEAGADSAPRRARAARRAPGICRSSRAHSAVNMLRCAPPSSRG
jgi:hypothetical protein